MRNTPRCSTLLSSLWKVRTVGFTTTSNLWEVGLSNVLAIYWFKSLFTWSKQNETCGAIVGTYSSRLWTHKVFVETTKLLNSEILVLLKSKLSCSLLTHLNWFNDSKTGTNIEDGVLYNQSQRQQWLEVLKVSGDEAPARFPPLGQTIRGLKELTSTETKNISSV